ncbi:MAG: DUF4352 domain-containing protein [Bacteroidales bacterium]|nr:DUF4352 domain-containing protein [Clostridium sp.]MCM1203149.1 DUF4352 domain-containing protein [Bacteroidales bacterium]
MNRQYVKGKIAICVLFMVGIMLAGCSGGKNANGSMKAEDGRSYGGLIQGKEGEVVHTAFFDVAVESAQKHDIYQFDDGLYQADKGNTYLVVELKITNTYEKDLPMSITDFTLDYEGNTSTDIITGYGKSDLQQEQFMENIFTLKRGDSITKWILFTVPDKEEYFICYSEYYEDEFEGDAYRIAVNAQKQENTSEEEAADK